MRDTHRVKIRQTPQDLIHEEPDQRLGKRPQRPPPHHARQRPRLHQLHYNVQIPPRLKRTQILHNIPMIQRLQELHLTHDTRDVALTQPLERHLLDGDVFPRLGIVCPVDPPVSTRTDALQELIPISDEQARRRRRAVVRCHRVGANAVVESAERHKTSPVTRPVLLNVSRHSRRDRDVDVDVDVDRGRTREREREKRREKRRRGPRRNLK